MAHKDDEAVDRFAAAMKRKLAQKRREGRRGWQKCSVPVLKHMLDEHVKKGDPVDIGNFAMMIWNKQEVL